uniref:Uncharacterized protein n=1 Tax=Panagrolaimus superbus TaxID=310955 RepID=A0A914Z473_9BILA
MRLAHRITYVWFCLVTSIVLLVIYLDGGLGNEAVVIFIIPLIFNIVAGAIIFIKYLSHLDMFLRNGPILKPLSGIKALYLGSMVISKTVFEVLLCLKLRGVEIETLYIFIPLWVLLVLTMIYLLSDVVVTHFKEH